jgi:hypothetical protein
VCVIIGFVRLIMSFIASFVGKVKNVIIILCQEFNQDFFLVGFRLVVARAIAYKGSLVRHYRFKPSGSRMPPVVVIILR